MKVLLLIIIHIHWNFNSPMWIYLVWESVADMSTHIQASGESAGRQRGARIDSLLEDHWQTFIFKWVMDCTLCRGALALVHSAQTDRGQCSVTWGDLMKIPSIWTPSISPPVVSPGGREVTCTFPCKHGDSRSGIHIKKKKIQLNKSKLSGIREEV